MKPRLFGHPFSLLMSLLAIAAATPAKSQPITPANDGTGTTLTPQGNEFNIEGGTRNEANLFHSFEQFNLNSGQTANFLSTPDTSNILGRVTGGNASIINGLIQVIGGNSNLLLMNPAGIIFGPNASLNVPASFSVTTATGIGFDNNNFWFQAMGTNDYSNLVGNPSGYRFNVSTPGAIVNEGNLHSGENLTLLGGTVINTGELSTAGGNITIAAVEGGSVLRISQPQHLLSLEVESKIEDISNLSPLSLPELLTGGAEKNATSIIVNNNGELELTDNTIIADTPGNVFASGNIDLSTQESESNFIVLANNDLTVNNLIETAGFVELKAGGSIQINGDIDTSVGNGNIDLFGNNDEINIANRSNGKASINQLDGTTLNAGSGTINIELGNLGEVGDINLASLTTTGEVLVNANGGNIARVSDNSLINARSILFQTSGSGGIGLIDAPLRLDVDSLEAVSGSGGVFFDVGNVNIGGVSEDVDGIATIGGGDIILESEGDVTVTESIRADVITDNETGGDINISAKNLSFIDGGSISVFTFGKGDAGNVEIHATDTIVFDGGNSGTLTGIFSQVNPGAEGNAGDVTITTRSLELKNIAQISTSTSGKGNAGSVEIHATDTIVFDGENSGTLTGIFSQVNPGAEGNAGDVTITTRSLELKNIAQISTSTSGKGNAGSVEIHATDTIVFDGGESKVFNGVTSQVNSGAEGNGGDITITTGSLELKNGARIDSSTSGKEDAGSVKIHATDTVVFDNGDLGFFVGIFSEVNQGAEGKGGDITITTGSLELKNGASISAKILGKGDAGSVEINATDTIVFDNGDSVTLTGVTSSVNSGAEGNAGDITITTGSLELKNGARILTSTSGKGNGGSVKIDATDTVVFDGISTAVFDGRSLEIPTQVNSSVNSGAEGNAGDITITTGSLE
ncbi:filamentous hemagglutinin N-terminal domain-containing protein, partial [Dapis sp. BLCC M126]|uniref:two-partner secretion domain-containing protein n=1 Tax=Dapis sp. BLCC M126 TaxID=3400189 RepID=UPI003CEA486D